MIFVESPSDGEAYPTFIFRSGFFNLSLISCGYTLREKSRDDNDGERVAIARPGKLA